MTSAGPALALFDTALGRMGIAWGDRGVQAIALPHARDPLTRARLRRAAPGAREQAPPHPVRAAIDGIVALLDGEPRDLSAVDLDLDGVEPFDRRVASVAREIGAGETVTYGELAERIGAPGEAREVGRALGRNRFPIVVPCHRVVAAGGALGGFSAPGGARTKLRLLELERRHAPGPLTLFEG